MSVFDETLFGLVPVLYREVDRALSARRRAAAGAGVPPVPELGSWVGGDRTATRTSRTR